MANIYELTNNFMQVYNMIEDEEIDEQVLIDTLDGIEGEIEDKADGYAKVIANITSDIDGIDEQIKRLQARKKTMSNKVKWLKTNLYETMKTVGKLKFKTSLFSFNIAKNGGKRKLTITKDITEIPEKFRVKQPDTINDAEIREYLKETNHDYCDFAVLEPQGESLRIK